LTSRYTREDLNPHNRPYPDLM